MVADVGGIHNKHLNFVVLTSSPSMLMGDLHSGPFLRVSIIDPKSGLCQTAQPGTHKKII